MKHLLFLLISFSAFLSFGQIRTYKGFIDKYPIQLITYTYSDDDIRATYAYDKFDTPIWLTDGKVEKGTLSFKEGDKKMIFSGFDPKSKTLNGYWVDPKTQKKLKVTLTKEMEFYSYDDTSFNNTELIQPVSAEDHYFKLLISKKAKEEVRVVGVKVYEKKTDKLIQKLSLDCQFWGLNSISVEDYNFDGILDFSVFEASYAGANTTSIYILRKKNSNQYFISEIHGVSLTFEAETKRVYEHNQCCGGRSQSSYTYKIVNNKLVLIDKECLEYNMEKEDFVEVNCD